MARVDDIGELRVIRGASWQADIGAVTEMLDHEEGSPAVVFDDVPGYASGRRVIVNCNGTPTRQAVTLGLSPEQGTHEGLFAYWRATLDELRPVQPREVADGPIFENVFATPPLRPRTSTR